MVQGSLSEVVRKSRVIKLKERKFKLFWYLDVLREQEPSRYEVAKKEVVFITSFFYPSGHSNTNWCISYRIPGISEGYPDHYKINGGPEEVSRLVREEMGRLRKEGFVHVRYSPLEKRIHPLRKVCDLS